MWQAEERCFVFVVCGSKEHIQTLHFSLNALKQFSIYPIVVVTDTCRNEIPIIHDSIIDMKTPSSFDHHQASIWLKTSLHHILPAGKLYCYLDSDVIALSYDCNKIFDQFVPPIIFAPDHTTVSYFSPYAVNCDCSDRYQKDKKELEQCAATILPHANFPPNMDDTQTRELVRFLNTVSKNYLTLIGFFFKIIYAFFAGKVKVSNNLYFNFRKKQWQSNDEHYTCPVLPLYRKKLKRAFGYRLSLKQKTWIKPNGEPISKNRCTHLHESIKNNMGYTLKKDWQQWNGGVFLFNDQSHDFMETWHHYTMQAFKDSYWKTRDQGTLIITVLHFKLQHHPTLSDTFNFIADYFKPEIYADEKNVIFYKGNTIVKPAFIHIYHHWNDTKWDVWNTAIKVLSMNTNHT